MPRISSSTIPIVMEVVPRSINNADITVQATRCFRACAYMTASPMHSKQNRNRAQNQPARNYIWHIHGFCHLSFNICFICNNKESTMRNLLIECIFGREHVSEIALIRYGDGIFFLGFSIDLSQF